MVDLNVNMFYLVRGDPLKVFFFTFKLPKKTNLSQRKVFFLFCDNFGFFVRFLDFLMSLMSLSRCLNFFLYVLGKIWIENQNFRQTIHRVRFSNDPWSLETGPTNNKTFAIFFNHRPPFTIGKNKEPSLIYRMARKPGLFYRPSVQVSSRP